MKSSFEYKGDLWRFNLISDQWEEIEVYGIASIRRQIYLWNGEPLTSDVPTKDKLKQDLENVYKLQQKDVSGDLTIELPKPRGGHAMVVVGNPPDYILAFGGVSEEPLDG